MHHRISLLIAFIMAVLLPVTAAHAQSDGGRFAIGPKISTLGLGGEAVLTLNERLDARLGVNAFDYSYDGTEDDIEYDVDAQLRNLSALIDLFPFSSGFRLTAGAVFNDNALETTARSSATYEIGGTTYTGAQIGSLNGDVDFNDVAPYIGLGWGRPFTKEGHWSISLDLGVMFQGEPDVTLSANGPIANDPNFQTDLSQEEASIEDDIDKYQFFPVVSLGILYRF